MKACHETPLLVDDMLDLDLSTLLDIQDIPSSFKDGPVLSEWWQEVSSLAEGTPADHKPEDTALGLPGLHGSETAQDRLYPLDSRCIDSGASKWKLYLDMTCCEPGINQVLSASDGGCAQQHRFPEAAEVSTREEAQQSHYNPLDGANGVHGLQMAISSS
jgi:hypothetical protein